MSLEFSRRVQATHEAKKEQEKILHPVSGEQIELGEYDRSVAEIARNVETSDAFYNHYLYQQDPAEAKDIVDSLASKTALTAKQEAFIEKHRKSFNLLSAKTEHIKDSFSEEQMAAIARVDPRIAQCVGQVGPQDAAKVFAQEVAKLAMDDTKKFNRLSNALSSIHKIENSDEARWMEQHVKEALKDFGLSEDQYIEATEKGLTADTKQNLQSAIREQYGAFKKFSDLVLFRSLSQSGSERLYANFEAQKKMLAECDVYYKAVGKILQGTLTSEVSAAIQKQMAEGGTLDIKNTDNIRTPADLRRVRDEYDPANVKARGAKYLEEEKKKFLAGKPKGTVLQPADVDAIQDKFANEEAEKIRKFKGGGLLTGLLSLLFGRMDKAAIKSML